MLKTLGTLFHVGYCQTNPWYQLRWESIKNRLKSVELEGCLAIKLGSAMM